MRTSSTGSSRKFWLLLDASKNEVQFMAECSVCAITTRRIDEVSSLVFMVCECGFEMVILPELRFQATTMASADFCQPMPTPCDVSSTRQADRSPRVRRATVTLMPVGFDPPPQRVEQRQSRRRAPCLAHQEKKWPDIASHFPCGSRANFDL